MRNAGDLTAAAREHSHGGRTARGEFPDTPTAERQGVVAMIVATLLWGATFVVVRDSLATLPPVPLVALRFALAALLFGVVLLARRPRWDRTAVRGALIGGAVSAPLTAGGYLFQAIGLTDTSAGSSAFLTCAGTVFAGWFAWPLLGLKPRAALAWGIALALAGSALLGIRDNLSLGLGEAWTFGGALIYALQIVAVARWVRGADPWVLAASQAAGTALLLVPFAGDLPALLVKLPAATWLRLAYLVVAGSMAAPLLQVMAQRALPPGRIGLLFALEPVFGLVFATVLGGERFVFRWWVGAALILGAVWFVEGGRRGPKATSRSATS